MKHRLRTLTALPVFAVLPSVSAPPSHPLVLSYDEPAVKWQQALPIGNRRLGAMIFGQPAKERVQLNDITVWSGGPQPDADRKDAWRNLPELRRLIREGKYIEAERFANASFNSPPADACVPP